MSDAYTRAGVDIDLGEQITGRIAKLAGATFRPEVLSGVGLFGGFFELKGYRQPVLVSSTDSVGTKLKIAIALGSHYSIGIDIVNHCVNDIFTGGAEPLFFLDYIAMGNLVAEKTEALVAGVADACRKVACALIGGETAALPGIYRGENYDLVGFIVGAVEKDAIIRGETIVAGDVVVGLPSSGLHTNGFSLVRSVFGETRPEMETYQPELSRTLGEALLEPHRCYFNEMKDLRPIIKGMAHITQGGLEGNVPRILPASLMASFDSRSWTVPPLFELIQARGKIARDEMYRVFNMGIGMAVVSAPENAAQIVAALPGAALIGEVAAQTGDARVVIR